MILKKGPFNNGNDSVEESRMTERKMKRNQQELVSLRHRANPHVYDRNAVDRKRRLRARIQHLKMPEPKSKK